MTIKIKYRYLVTLIFSFLYREEIIMPTRIANIGASTPPLAKVSKASPIDTDAKI